MAAAPGAPTGLIAQATDSKVLLNWTAPADDGGGALDGYNLYRCEEGGSACTPVWIAWVDLSDGTTYSDSGVTADTEYRYAVDSSRAGGLSASSNQVTVTAEDPGAPTELNANGSDNKVALWWTAPEADGGGALDGYNIYRCEEGQTACTPVWIAWVNLADGTTYSDSGVTADTEYRYAVNSSRAGATSTWSNQVTVTAEDPGAPTELNANANDDKVALWWTAPEADGGGALDGYNIYRCEEGQTACTPVWIAWVDLSDGTTYSDSDVTTNTEYRYAVGSSRASALSIWSNQVTVTAEDPGAPTALTAQANESLAVLNWTAPAADGGGALDGYNVYRCEEGQTACTPVWIAWVNLTDGTTYSDTDITKDTKYRYAIDASRAGEASAWSNQVTVTAVAPAAPTALQVTSRSNTAISLRWTAPADNGGGAVDSYNVYRCDEGEMACTPEWHAWVETGTTYTDSGVTAGATYRYAVRALRLYSGTGRESPWSGQVTAEATTVRATLVLNVDAIATDNRINIAEKAAGFTVSGDTGSVGSVSVSVEVGSTTLTTTSSSADPATWSVSVPAAASYITESSVSVDGLGIEDRIHGTERRDAYADRGSHGTLGARLYGTILAQGRGGDHDDEPLGLHGHGHRRLQRHRTAVGVGHQREHGTISGTPDTANANTQAATVTITDTGDNTRTASITFPAVVKGDQTLTGFSYSASQITYGDTAPTVTAPSGIRRRSNTRRHRRACAA